MSAARLWHMYCVNDLRGMADHHDQPSTRGVLATNQHIARPRASDVLQSPTQRRGVREFLPRGYWAVKRRGAAIQHSLMAMSPLAAWGENRYEARRSDHADNLPRLSREHTGVLADLRNTGVAVRNVELPAAVLDSAYRFVETLRSKRTDEPCAKTTSRELALNPTLFMWGLSADLLDLAECHIGLPPRYLGVEVKREIVNPAAGHSHEAVRRWHADHEDRRILKVIVYLSEVDSASAPFEYVDLPASQAVLNRRGRPYRSARLDEAVRAEIPEPHRRQVTGPPMTAIYVDTGQVLHRVCPPRESERYSVTFAYCSRSPVLTYSQLMMPGAALRGLRDYLSPRQWQALCRKGIGLTPARRAPQQAA
jgi:hypothetical protein